jgi:hypothetical protein
LLVEIRIAIQSASIFVSVFALSHSPVPGRMGLIDNIFTRRELRNGFQEKEQQCIHSTDHPPGNNDLLILTRLLPSNDDSHNNFSGISPKTRFEIMTNQATL